MVSARLVTVEPTRRSTGGIAVELAPGDDNFFALMGHLQAAVSPAAAANSDDARVTELPTHADALAIALVDDDDNGGGDGDDASSVSEAMEMRPRRPAGSAYDDDDGDNSYDSADDSVASLDDFIVADEDDDDIGDGKVVYSDDEDAQTALAKMRVNYGMGTRDCFRSLLYYIARCVLNKQYVRRISDVTNTETAILSGRQARQMWQQPVDYAERFLRSEVWSADTVKLLRTRCLALLMPMTRDEKRRHGGTNCQICRRRGHPIAVKLVLMGVFDADAQSRPAPDAYDGTYLFDDVRRMHQLQSANGGGDDVPIRGQPTNVLLCGVHCGERMLLYHQLIHFWQMCGWRCFNTLADHRRTGTPKERALRVLDSKEQELERACWKRFQRVCADADEYRPGGRHASAGERFE